MIRRCPRCGDPYALFTVDQRHCRRCDEEVKRLIEADTKRAVRLEQGPDGTRGRVIVRTFINAIVATLGAVELWVLVMVHDAALGLPR